MALYHRFKRQFFSQVWLVRALLLLVATALFLALWFLAFKPLIPTLSPLFRSLTARLPQSNGRTNFLLLGVAGGDHAGSDLTDTIIFTSISHSSGDTVLLSIPRDLWVPSLRAKINTAYHYGEDKQPDGGGFTLARAAVSESLDQPIHYVAIINFSGFEKFIDQLGGVDITVDSGFIDTRFPIPGREDDPCNDDPEYACRYETLEFASGPQRLTGATALKFIRSRNAVGDEGTDFARSRRQEKLILAVKNKLLSTDVLVHPQRLRSLIQILSQSVTTDISPEIYPALLQLGLKSLKTSIRAFALTEPDQIYHPPLTAAQDYQWVLLPKNNDPATLFSYVKNLLSEPVHQ